MRLGAGIPTGKALLNSNGQNSVNSAFVKTPEFQKWTSTPESA